MPDMAFDQLECANNVLLETRLLPELKKHITIDSASLFGLKFALQLQLEPQSK
jgi:hypothetical protein